MKYVEEFEHIVRFNFGETASVTECETLETQNDWTGFAEEWVSASGLPEQPSDDEWSFEATVAVHLREHLPSVIAWAVTSGVADELAEYWECDEFMPALAEILLIRVMGSHCSGGYCDGVGQQSIALLDFGRLAVAFVEAYEGRCGR